MGFNGLIYQTYHLFIKDTISSCSLKPLRLFLYAYCYESLTGVDSQVMEVFQYLWKTVWNIYNGLQEIILQLFYGLFFTLIFVLVVSCISRQRSVPMYDLHTTYSTWKSYIKYVPTYISRRSSKDTYLPFDWCGCSYPNLCFYLLGRYML